MNELDMQRPVVESVEISFSEPTKTIATVSLAQLPELNPKQIELGLEIKVEDKFEGDL